MERQPTREGDGEALNLVPADDAAVRLRRCMIVSDFVLRPKVDLDPEWDEARPCEPWGELTETGRGDAEADLGRLLYCLEKQLLILRLILSMVTDGVRKVPSV